MIKKYILTFILISTLFSQIDTVVTINASSFFDWVYFSFENSSIVQVEDPQNSDQQQRKDESACAGSGCRHRRYW